MSCFELLPYEVVLLIFKHISTRDLWRNVRLVSRYFASILDNDRLWISRIQYKYKIELPKLDFEQPLVRYCAEIEEELSLWGNDIRDR
ncbi:hypothetical protein AB6A40_003136 [Gnathostoma spinigerum]|uniref:F-box domain-containing protein n=1 Tax=Gnathostoma spinigerum TaxID=75299 RepID=A0ABD6EIC3_9BILA